MSRPPSRVDNLLQTTYINRVPDVYIELPEYKFFHSPNPLDHDNQDDRFIGREDLLKKLKLILTHSDTKAGAYLITGFRGMGKTSVVRKAIADINRDASSKKNYKNKRYEPIEISLAQDDLKEIDVLRLISRHLQKVWEKEKAYKFIDFLVFPRYRKLFKQFKSIKKKLDELNIRINAELRIEKGQYYNFDPRIGFSGNYLGIKGQTGSIKASENRVSSYPIAGAKEVEWILINILSEIQEFRKTEKHAYKKSGPDILFIFDELDKIEPYISSSIEEKETENPHFDEKVFAGGTDKVRRRRETIAQLLANLKNFLNVAKAKFIFIGGREMYDASLADIADRDSFYSSIFHDILYVDSFLKDQAGQYAKGITEMTETYLSKILIPPFFLSKRNKSTEEKEFQSENQIYNLRVYYDFLCENHLEGNKEEFSSKKYEPSDQYTNEKLKHFIFLLQNFVIFLVYRSNGTPKKLTGLCEDFMIRGNKEVLKNPYNLVIGREWREENNDSTIEGRVFFRFTAQQQYEINLISNIYRPYIITQKRHLKFLGDKLLFSTSFIIDHLFKFHSFGFSWRNLELIPEIITINKAPQLRRFVQSLIEQYSKTFIRPTTGGVFQYKFYNKPANEIKYISKISEQSSAAFNFTLDESLFIKRHYYKKLASLKRNYQLFSSTPDGSGYINSVGFIHMILGDLHFYDKEYDDAIVQYTDGMQLLRNKGGRNLTDHQTILLIEKTLKLGLTLEKIQSYNSAYTLYGGLIKDIPKWIKAFAILTLYDPGGEESTQFRTLKLLSQPFVSFLHILEKLRRGGITDFDLKISEEQLLESLAQSSRDVIELSNSENYSFYQDYPEIDNANLFQLLLSNYYGNVGTILYFKNKNFSYLIRKLKDYSFTYKQILEQITPNKKRESYTNVEHNQAFWEFLNLLCKADRRDYNPSLSAYINYMESIRWFLIRYDEELKPIREFIKNNETLRNRYKGIILVKK